MMIYLYLDLQGSTPTPVKVLQHAWRKHVSEFMAEHQIEQLDILDPEGDGDKVIDCGACDSLKTTTYAYKGTHHDDLPVS